MVAVGEHLLVVDLINMSVTSLEAPPCKCGCGYVAWLRTHTFHFPTFTSLLARANPPGCVLSPGSAGLDRLTNLKGRNHAHMLTIGEHPLHNPL